jgi:hypothetical protein
MELVLRMPNLRPAQMGCSGRAAITFLMRHRISDRSAARHRQIAATVVQPIVTIIVALDSRVFRRPPQRKVFFSQ